MIRIRPQEHSAKFNNIFTGTMIRLLQKNTTMPKNTDEQLVQHNSKTENGRARFRPSKYGNQMAWRRNKVKELIGRVYTQHEIANTLHISQPTISRDIHHIQNHPSSLRVLSSH
jgi:DNA-binding NarL/FixJ family response regulator